MNYVVLGNAIVNSALGILFGIFGILGDNGKPRWKALGLQFLRVCLFV
jgi:hypothetical protein